MQAGEELGQLVCRPSHRNELMWPVREWHTAVEIKDVFKRAKSWRSEDPWNRVTVWFIVSECVQGNWKQMQGGLKLYRSFILWKNITIDGICIIFAILNSAWAPVLFVLITWSVGKRLLSSEMAGWLFVWTISPRLRPWKISSSSSWESGAFYFFYMDLVEVLWTRQVGRLKYFFYVIWLLLFSYLC